MKYISRHEKAVRAMLKQPAIISVSGPLGIGKTRFLQHCRDLVRDQQETQDTVAVYVSLEASFTHALVYKDTLSEVQIQNEAACHTLRVLAEKLRAAGHKAENTLDAVQQRADLVKGIASETGTSNALSSTGDALEVLSPLLEGFVPVVALGRILSVSIDSLSKRADHRRRRRDSLLLRHPIEALTEAFIDDLQKLLKSKRCIILLDDLKLTAGTLVEWLRDRLIRGIGAEESITWVLSSWRKLPGEEWQIPGLDFVPIELTCFSSETLKGNLSHARFYRIDRTLKHFPEAADRDTFLPQLVDNADKYPGADSHCCKSLADSLKAWLNDGDLFKQIRSLSIARQFDQHIAERLSGIDDRTWDHLLEECEGRLVHRQGLKYYFDPEVRYALVRYTQIQRGMEKYWAEHSCLAVFYQERFPVSFENLKEIDAHHSDIFSKYEPGLQQLLNRMGKNHPRYSEVLGYQQRLIENIDIYQQHGDNEARRSERSQIIAQLNKITLTILRIPFIELCRKSSTDTMSDLSRDLTDPPQMPHLCRKSTPGWSNFVEWFYHALSSSIDPASVLLVGLQYAIFRLENLDEINPLIETIFQVANERHEDKEFLDQVWLMPPPQAVKDRNGESCPPKAYEKRFKVWGELLDECADELASRDSEPNWQPIKDFCQALVDRSKIDSRIAPKVIAEAYWRLAEIHQRSKNDEKAKMCLRGIVRLADQHQGDRWWNEFSQEAHTELSSIEGTPRCIA